MATNNNNNGEDGDDLLIINTAAAADESSPLLGGSSSDSSSVNTKPFRVKLYDFLEAKTYYGSLYESFMILLIIFNVLCFIFGTLFVSKYDDGNDEFWSTSNNSHCGRICDAILFGNDPNNALRGLNIGSTSILEIFTVAVFSLEYVLRLWTCDLESSSKYSGFMGRIRYIPTFFSMVDLASTIPFYIDAFFLTNQNLAGSAFLRMFRLLRMMRVEGRYDMALTKIDDVIVKQKPILITAGFVGFTTWMAVSSLYYLVERHNPNLIYCEGDCNDFVPTDCTFDNFGEVTCPGCAEDTYCYNLYESIPSASYYSLLNLFGEFPHVADHSWAGKIVGTFTAIIAVAVFAIPVGIIGNGLEDVIESNRDESAVPRGPIQETSGMTQGFVADEREFDDDDDNAPTKIRAKMYNFLHAQTSYGSGTFDNSINILILVTAFAFMLDTLVVVGGDAPHSLLHVILDVFELLAVIIFTLEYVGRVYSCKEDPKYCRVGGRFLYASTFLSIVDLLSFLPYWIEFGITGGRGILDSDPDNTYTNLVKCLRLFRILRFEKYTHAFLTFDDVVKRNLDILAVTAFTAILFWIFFATCLYFSERNSTDDEMASYYKTIPDSMWITLLNLSGESPLSQYSFWGKVVTGILGIFATGVFGIPIGVMGAGFEEIMTEENEDNVEELRPSQQQQRDINLSDGSYLEQICYKFVNGLGGIWSQRFELLVYALIIISVAIGAWQTVEGQEHAFHEVEWLAVLVFTFEYIGRLIGAGADPEFAPHGPLMSRLRFIISFYSVIDLLAILPFYLAVALPNSIVNEYDEYLRMFRILRLVKLDKYIPSITLIDDVIRLKFKTLRVAFYAAVTLWIIFAAALFLAEHKDYRDDIDAVPLYGCEGNCTMSVRFNNFFESMVYTGIHLTGDYPIIEYSWPGRFINFFMVIAAVGVVSIPSGLIASGFIQIVQSKNRKLRGEEVGVAGDDWYEFRYRELEGTEPPPSRFGPTIDRWQLAVNEFLNGRITEDGHHKWSPAGYAGRVFIFTVIVTNVAAVLLESVPKIDKAVGNESGNAFDRFEFFSVMVFATEYILRLFCAPKNREALYSTFIYATTFFGIVDFLSTAPWFIEQFLIATGNLDEGGDKARIFRIFRIFRILQLEDFVVAFSKLDNVFRASKDVLKATGLMAIIVWVGCGALFFIFEENNPNWRTCDDSIPLHTADGTGCYDFASTSACNAQYPGLCEQSAFRHMPDALYYTAVFLGGEWGVVDFTWPGRIVCLFLCIAGIGLYSIPIGTLFDSFGAVLGIGGDDEEEEDNADEENGNGTTTGDVKQDQLVAA